jgi:hypothetical protein
MSTLARQSRAPGQDQPALSENVVLFPNLLFPAPNLSFSVVFIFSRFVYSLVESLFLERRKKISRSPLQKRVSHSVQPRLDTFHQTSLYSLIDTEKLVTQFLLLIGRKEELFIYHFGKLLAQQSELFLFSRFHFSRFICSLVSLLYCWFSFPNTSTNVLPFSFHAAYV